MNIFFFIIKFDLALADSHLLVGRCCIFELLLVINQFLIDSRVLCFILSLILRLAASAAEQNACNSLGILFNYSEEKWFAEPNKWNVYTLRFKEDFQDADINVVRCTDS